MDMPEIMESMPGPVPSKHDWAEIFDGRVRRFTPAECPGSPRNFGRQVRLAANRAGIDVDIVVRAQEGVFVRARR